MQNFGEPQILQLYAIFTLYEYVYDMFIDGHALMRVILQTKLDLKIRSRDRATPYP